MIWDIVMAVAAVAAVIISVVTLRLSRRDAGAAATSARGAATSANNSAKAAADAAAALERTAKVAEREEALRTPAWTLDKVSPHRWKLVNMGSATAYELTFYLSTTGPIEEETTPTQMRPNESMQFTTFVGMGVGPATLRINWRRFPGDVGELYEQILGLPRF